MFANNIKNLIRRFSRDQAGNYAMMFALAAPALFGSVAIAVENASLQQSRVQLQNALDIAALATGKQLAVTTDEAALKIYAKDFFEANLNTDLDKSKILFNFQFVSAPNSGKRIRLTADYDYPVTMKILGLNEILLDIKSEVTAGNRTIEVALVIDNSGSMDTNTGGSKKTRLANAKEAATALTSQLFALGNISNKPDPVKIAVVPFGHSVNVGSDKRGEPWMDMNGWSSIHHENIAWDATTKRGDKWPNLTTISSGYQGSPNGNEELPTTPAGPGGTPGVVSVDWLTRWTLFDSLDTAWDGCVEMRPWPFNTTDGEPNANNGDTLFVPMFAPDEPDEDISNNEDNDYTNNYLYDYRRVYNNPDGLTDKTNNKYYLKKNIPNQGNNYGNFTRQNWRQDWAMKYNSLSKNSKYGDYRSRDIGNYGPNLGCTTDPITPLATSALTANTAIDNMDAGGYTNVQAGIAWGWRVLSPGEPFIQGRNYTAKENDKYIIVLTDGNNTYPGQNTYNYSEYTSWGYEKSGRVYEGTTGNQTEVGAMNQHTAQTCANLKTIIDGDNEPAYKIFTIAYDVSNGSSVKELLYNCASDKAGGGKYYYDVSGDALADALRAIGNEISDLRISQ